MAAFVSGSTPFRFSHCEDLRSVPQAALAHESRLHGCFTVDHRSGQGEIYYSLAGCGVIRISSDLSTQEIIELPGEFVDVNFHSTRLGQIEGKTRLVLAANLEEKVLVVGLDGSVDYVLDRPEFDEYADVEQPFKPTDSVIPPLGVTDAGLLVADGYGSNYILGVDTPTHQWSDLFGGKTEDPAEHGRFGTAHGMNIAPSGRHLSIADRLHSRLEQYTFDGQFIESFAMPAGSRPCGIDYMQRDGQWFAVVGSLNDPDPNRPAPIYILDGISHNVLSTIRPKEELGIELADHIHNVVWLQQNGNTYLICQAWNPGFYFVLVME